MINWDDEADDLGGDRWGEIWRRFTHPGPQDDCFAAYPFHCIWRKNSPARCLSVQHVSGEYFWPQLHYTTSVGRKNLEFVIHLYFGDTSTEDCTAFPISCLSCIFFFLLDAKNFYFRGASFFFDNPVSSHRVTTHQSGSHWCVAVPTI